MYDTSTKSFEKSKFIAAIVFRMFVYLPFTTTFKSIGAKLGIYPEKYPRVETHGIEYPFFKDTDTVGFTALMRFNVRLTRDLYAVRCKITTAYYNDYHQTGGGNDEICLPIYRSYRLFDTSQTGVLCPLLIFFSSREPLTFDIFATLKINCNAAKTRLFYSKLGSTYTAILQYLKKIWDPTLFSGDIGILPEVMINIALAKGYAEYVFKKACELGEITIAEAYYTNLVLRWMDDPTCQIFTTNAQHVRYGKHRFRLNKEGISPCYYQDLYKLFLLFSEDGYLYLSDGRRGCFFDYEDAFYMGKIVFLKYLPESVPDSELKDAFSKMIKVLS